MAKVTLDMCKEGRCEEESVLVYIQGWSLLVAPSRTEQVLQCGEPVVRGHLWLTSGVGCWQGCWADDCDFCSYKNHILGNRVRVQREKPGTADVHVLQKFVSYWENCGLPGETLTEVCRAQHQQKYHPSMSSWESLGTSKITLEYSCFQPFCSYTSPSSGYVMEMLRRAYTSSCPSLGQVCAVLSSWLKHRRPSVLSPILKSHLSSWECSGSRNF